MLLGSSLPLLQKQHKHLLPASSVKKAIHPSAHLYLLCIIMVGTVPRKVLLLCALGVAACFLGTAEAFIAAPSSNMLTRKHSRVERTASVLHERKWNFNDGQGPFGMKKNAEIWNGRLAQMAFVIVLLQELIQGKGVVQGVQEGDPLNVAILGAFAVTVVGLTGWLAIKGEDDYVRRDLDN